MAADGTAGETGPATGAEGLALRARPRPVTRINRRVLMLVARIALILIFGATLFALSPRSTNPDDTARELYRTGNNPTPDGLEALPRTYGEAAEETPELGPPLAGEIGPAVVGLERELGIAPALPFRPSPEDDAARAERIRIAQAARQARESGVLFSLTSTTAAAGPGAPSPILVSTGRDAGAAGDDAEGAGASIGEDDPNRQGPKQAFLARPAPTDIYNPHPLQDPVSPYQMVAGTVIAASLVTGINSDLPGRVIAQVTTNVYDTVTGNYLLIPQGSRLIGIYDSVIAFGQERALVVWQRLIMPDGSSVVIENLPATDAAGYAGLADEVDFHTWRLLKGIVLSTLLSVGTELTFGEDESDLVKAIRESAQDNIGTAGERLTERNLDIQPTITIRPGWPLRVIVHSDLVLRPYRG